MKDKAEKSARVIHGKNKCWLMSLSLIFVGKIIPVSGENFWVQLFKNLIDFYAPTRLWKLIKYVDIFLAHSMRRNKYLASRKSFTYLSYILCIGLLYNDMRKPVTILRFIWETIVKIKCLFLMLLYYAPCCARNTGIEFFLNSSFFFETGAMPTPTKFRNSTNCGWGGSFQLL